MIGRILCWLGIHRWEWRDEAQPDRIGSGLGSRLVTYARCRRDCREHGEWSMVNVDRRPW